MQNSFCQRCEREVILERIHLKTNYLNKRGSQDFRLLVGSFYFLNSSALLFSNQRHDLFRPKGTKQDWKIVLMSNK
jgi:hypothetical protein